MANSNREDRSAEQRFEVALQAVGTVQDDRHRLGRVGPEPPFGRFGPRPRPRPLATPERAPDFLVQWPVQSAIFAPPQCVHHHQHHFLAVLALVPFPTAFLAATPLTLHLAAMTLAAAGTALGVPPPGTTPFPQLLLPRRRRTFAVHLDHQHFTIVLRCRQLLHEGPSLTPQS